MRGRTALHGSAPVSGAHLENRTPGAASGSFLAVEARVLESAVNETDHLKRQLAQERKARVEAERMLETLSAELNSAIDRAREESDLRLSSEGRLSEAIEHMSEGFVIYDENDRFVLCNSRNREIFAATADLFVPGKHIGDILRESARRGQYRTSYNNDEAWFERRMDQFRKADGVFVEHLSSGQWVQTRDRRTRNGFTIGVRTDITDLMLRERDLRASEERFRSVTEAARDGIVAIDLAGNILTWNEGASNVLGYPREDTVDLCFLDILSGIDRQEFRKALDRMSDMSGFGVATDIHNVVCRTAAGEEVPVEISASSWISEEGPCFSLVVRDITARLAAEQEQARLEHQLRHMQKLESLGTLAGGTAHEFNNMLVPMIGLTEIVLEDLPENSPERENLQMVLDAGMRARELVKKILAFSREQPRETNALDIRETVTDALQFVRQTVPSTIELVEHLDDEELIVWADATELHQVILNVIANAAHAIGNGVGTIEVKLGSEMSTIPGPNGPASTPHCLISISDSGCGMDEQTLGRIFEPFYTTKNVGEGTGLGLAMIHAIITRLEGTVDVKSRVGEGTCFEIRLPLVALEEFGETPLMKSA